MATLDEAQKKRDAAESLTKEVGSLQDAGETDRADRVAAEADDLSKEADQDETEAKKSAEKEKAEVDDKYGTG